MISLLFDIKPTYYLLIRIIIIESGSLTRCFWFDCRSLYSL